MRKFSIIVPVYNCAIYLDNCIKSILEQEFTDFELILIDDGSTDNSLSICRKYENSDQRVKVVHKENGGVSSARNAGLLYATGEYITFIDSDDFISKKTLLHINNLISDVNVDIIKCSYYKIFGKYKVEYKFTVPCNSLINKDLYEVKVYPYIFDTFDLSNVWATFFKKSILENIKFSSELSYAEDMKFVFDAIKSSDSIYFLNLPLYNYCFNSSSAINAVNLDKLKQKLFDNKYVFEYIFNSLGLSNISYDRRFINLLNEILIITEFKSFNEYLEFLKMLVNKEILSLDELKLYNKKKKYLSLKALKIYFVLKNKIKKIMGGFSK